MARVLPPLTTTSARLAVGIVVASIAWALTRNGLGAWLLLSPRAVLQHGAVWQVATYALLATDPLGVMFSAFLTWTMGGWLEGRWGKRRMLVFSLGTTVLAGVLTVGVSWFWSAVAVSTFDGARVLTSVLWVTYGLSLRRNQVSFFGLPMTGEQFALLGVAWAVLTGIFGSWVAIVPEGFALGLSYLFNLNGALNPKTLWLRMHGAWIERRMRARGKHLRLLDNKRNTSRDSDRYLH
ncbi:MAG: DUF1751 domain-containing protein [Myxococcaceae bacterium]